MIFLFSDTPRPTLVPGLKRPQPDVDHLLPSRAEVKIDWSCASTPPIHVHSLMLITQFYLGRGKE